MTVAFAIKPSASIFRSVINGDDALSPSTKANVMFDAYGAKLHALTLQGTVPYSSFGSNTSTSVPPGSGASSASYRAYQINFPQPLSYIPFLFALEKNPSGAWVADYIDNQTYGSSSLGVFLNNGSAGAAGGFATTTYLFLYWYIVNWPNNRSVTPPTEYSYRLYGV